MASRAWPALAGAAAVLFALYNTQVTPFMGFTPGIKAFTAAVLGGIGNIPGAMAGGLLLGMLESVSPALLGLQTQLQDVIAFGVLVLILIFKALNDDSVIKTVFTVAGNPRSDLSFALYAASSAGVGSLPWISRCAISSNSQRSAMSRMS